MKLFYIFITIVILLKPLTAQISADSYYDVLDHQFRQNINKSGSFFLINEFKEYLLIFPNSKQEDEALFNLSQLYKIKNDIAAQLFTLVKLNILHPKSPLSIRAYHIIDSVTVYNNSLHLTPENESAIKEINNMTPSINHQAASLALLSFLHYAEIKIFDALLIEEIRNYRILYGKNSQNLDALNYWQASAYRRKGETAAAMLSFQKVSQIFPKSKFASASLLAIAEIYTANGKHKMATDCLIELINQYPDAPETGDAQFALAQLYHFHYKDLNEALTNYKMLAQVFPDNRNFNAALLNAAVISEDMGDYSGALNSYMMIVENNKKSEQTLESLKNILRIHLDIQKDYLNAAQDYLLISQMFPENKNAAQNLLNAARLYFEKIKDNKKATEILKIILTNYKDTPQAKEAESLLSSK